MHTRRDVLALLAAPALILGCVAGAPAIGDGADSVAQVPWRDPDPRFGGLSALHVSQDGLRAIAIGDRGMIWQAQLQRDAAGRLVGVQSGGGALLRDTDGEGLRAARSDAEALVIDRAGQMFVAFEGRPARLLRYANPSATPVELPLPDEASTWRVNTGPEALAMDPQGRLIVIPENTLGVGFPVHRLQSGQWQRVGQIPRRGDFLPVGADFGPDGQMYLLERQFKRPFFATRISRIQPERWDNPATLLQSQPGQFDNLEGISVGRTLSGKLRITCVSDNNFNWFQRMELVEWTLG